MRSFLTTKAGILSIVILVGFVVFAFVRVNQRSRARDAATAATPAAIPATPPKTEKKPAEEPADSLKNNGVPKNDAKEERAERSQQQMQCAAYLSSYRLAGQTREERDRNGHTSVRRLTASKPHDAGKETVEETPPAPASRKTSNTTNLILRLQGRAGSIMNVGRKIVQATQEFAEEMGVPAKSQDSSAALASQEAPEETSEPAAQAKPAEKEKAEKPARPKSNAVEHTPRSRPARFLPYGFMIKCELVFTIDSTMEATPLIGLVVAPVYNNGQLIIPAGAELHSMARPDRVRDRLYSGQDWVLIFPREGSKPNGRQLNVRGLALNRDQPDDNGLTWGITDGSYGLQGDVIRTTQNEEIQQFAAAALGVTASAMQSRHESRSGQELTDNTIRNASLQGLSTSLNQIAEKIRAEIERNGVFIRVPAGKQFYFYPQQIINPDIADISSNVAAVQ